MVKLNFGWLGACAAVVIAATVAACGSNGSSMFPGGDGGGSDVTKGDGPHFVFEGGGDTSRPPQCNKLTCATLGYNCGPAGDGCGNSLNCGSCTAPETCGGGGKFSQCGGTSACVPKTCGDLGINCGPAGDGCGNALDCGTCTAPNTCGGGGMPSICGNPFPPEGGLVDGGLCVPLTCAGQKISCGPAGDGCGGKLDCGTCETGTCGGGGVPSTCGSSTTTCTPKTCADLGFNCGPAGDGCGGSLSCGTCTSPESCGGGGKPSECGSGVIIPDGGIEGGLCVPVTCASQGISCGPAGDGCGNKLNCGSCDDSSTCGGGGTHGVCGSPAPCVPTTCVALGYTCGPAGDGCGGSLNCGTCTAPDTCGGGGTPSVCGTSFVSPDGGLDGGACVPMTCASQGISCGPAGDGCGNSLNCGGCDGGTCGGGGTPGACGSPVCVPLTCATLGFNCGPAGDGCGGSLDCGTCVSPNICGGGGVPGQCGDVPPCTGLCKDVPPCDGGTTTITGTVVSGAQSPYLTTPDGGVTGTPDPVPNVLVYIPNATPAPFTDGPACGCAPVSGEPLVGSGQTATTDYLGNFTLTNVPVPPGGVVPIVIQLGKWRRIFGLGNVNNPGVNVNACMTNSAGNLHMPRNQGEGDIPLTAISTGNVDAMECVLLQMGVDQAEFTDPPGYGSSYNGRIHLYVGNGGTATGSTPPESTLVGGVDGGANLLGNYDQVIFPCFGNDPRSGGSAFKTPAQQANVVNYTDEGGRMFATHYSYGWTYNIAPFDQAAVWIGDSENTNGTAQIVPPPSGWADVDTFYEWMNALTTDGASTGSFFIIAPRNDFNTPSSNTELWMNLVSPAYPLTLTFTTPYLPPPAPPATCGKVIYNDFHVANSGGTSGHTFPSECPASGALTPQEKSLEYLIWDLASCPPGPPPPTCTPLTCADQGFNCGPQGDGCGGSLDCGTCSGCEDCGGGGIPGVCGGTCCKPETCASEGISCGPAGDGCGGTLNCGTCTPPETCGGGGVDGKCGFIDAGACVPETCATLGYNCGPAGDGCGGSLNCGTCTGCQTCGGAGVPGVCGGTCCVPETCGSQGIFCGPAGDGCGGTLNCGTCTPPDTCGGGGVSGKCGSEEAGTPCVPETCADQGFNCGPAGDGCGGSLSCGTCSGCAVCGGGGPGVCGGSCCVPETCAGEGIECGPAGDGCGGSLNCGPCPAGEECGGGGKPGKCGAPDGSACKPETCADQSINCGPAGDGCGGSLNCGVCPMGETCGGGGVSGTCGKPMCTPKTCAELGFNCGPAGDGCGGSLNCGTCTGADTCGGGGAPGVCGMGSGPK